MKTNSIVIKAGSSLNNDLRAIGFNIACEKKSIDPNIELALVSASVKAVNGGDNRISGLLVDWLTVHYLRINMDRLTRIIVGLNGLNYKFIRIFWCANAQRFLAKDQRFKRLSEWLCCT